MKNLAKITSITKLAWFIPLPLRLNTFFLQRSYSSNVNTCESIVKYLDADKDKVKIFSENRNKAGVYLWTNKLNGNNYVGSSINLSVRFYTYYSLRSLAKSNRPLERALLKYGFSNFSLDILEYCNPEDAVKREQYYLDLLKPKYNIVKLAASTLGYKHTEESLKKMRDFILSDEVLAKKKLATINATEARKAKVLVINTETKETKIYVSITEASKALGVSKAAVSQALLNNKLLKKLYKIEKVI
jgi:hypothetical protein